MSHTLEHKNMKKKYPLTSAYLTIKNGKMSLDLDKLPKDVDLSGLAAGTSFAEIEKRLGLAKGPF